MMNDMIPRAYAFHVRLEINCCKEFYTDVCLFKETVISILGTLTPSYFVSQIYDETTSQRATKAKQIFN